MKRKWEGGVREGEGFSWANVGGVEGEGRGRVG